MRSVLHDKNIDTCIDLVASLSTQTGGHLVTKVNWPRPKVDRSRPKVDWSKPEVDTS